MVLAELLFTSLKPNSRELNLAAILAIAAILCANLVVPHSILRCYKRPTGPSKTSSKYSFTLLIVRKASDKNFEAIFGVVCGITIDQP